MVAHRRADCDFGINMWRFNCTYSLLESWQVENEILKLKRK